MKVNLAPVEETLDELVIQIRPSTTSVERGAAEMRDVALEDRYRDDDELLEGEDSGLLETEMLEPRGRRGLQSSRKGSGVSYLEYKAEEDKMASASLSKPITALLSQREESQEDLKSLAKLKARVLEIRDNDETRLAMMHGLHKGLAVLLAGLFFVLPYFSRFSSFPVWVAATAISVTTTYSGSSVRRCFNEALGSAMGALLGYAFISLVAFTGPSCIQCSYKPIMVLGGLFIFIFSVSTYGNKFKKWEQVCDLSNSSFLLIVGVEYLGNNLDNINTQYVFDRAAMIMAGVLVAFVTSYMIFPVKGSKRIQKGLKNVLATDFGFVISGVLDLYGNASYVDNVEERHTEEGSTEAIQLKEVVAERKKLLYGSASSVFGKTSQMKSLIDTTKGEVVIDKQAKCKLAFFPGDKFTTIMFCTNQLMYITLTLFYGLHGGATNTRYCQLFSKQLDTIRARFEKMFVSISSLLEADTFYLDVLSHIRVVNTLLEQMEKVHRENLVNGVALKYTFDEVQAFSHLWMCLKLYIRKTIHLVDSIMRLYEQ